MITARDRQVLHDLSRHRLLTTSQIQWLRFPHIEPCRRRLRTLVKVGLIKRHSRPTVTIGRSEYLFSLTGKGRGLLRLQHGGRGNSRVPSSYLFVDHLLAVNGVLIAFRVACRETGYSLDFLHEHEFKSKTSKQGFAKNPTVIPDAVVSLRNPKGKRSLLYLEIDLDTESLTSRTYRRKTIAGKLAAYSALLGSRSFFQPEFDDGPYSYRGFRVLWVVPDERRLDGILKLAMSAPQSAIFWLSTKDNLTTDGIFQPVWRVPNKADLVPLVRGEMGPRSFGAGCGAKGDVFMRPGRGEKTQ